MIKNYIKTYPDFPKKGIMYRDVMSLVKNKDGLKETIDLIADNLKDVNFDIVVGPESRGFIFGVPVAYKMNKSFVPVRKPNKLPGEVVSEDYILEYGKDTLQVQLNSINKGDRVVIIDDLMATGGTTKAITSLVEKCGGIVVRIMFVIELLELNGREKLKGYDVVSLVEFKETEM